MSTARTPIVEMLWETARPTDVLYRRFGFADERATREWLSAVLERHWGVAVSGCSRIVMSDQNALAWLATSVGGLVAKWSVAHERFDRLSELADLTLWLGEQGAPVSGPVPTDAGSTSVSTDGALVTVQRVIRGDHLDVGNTSQVEAAGAVMARLHDDLAGYPCTERLRRTSSAPSGALAERVATWLDADRPHIPLPLRASLRELLRSVPDGGMPVHLVHGDYRAANLLCVDSRIAAVIDFEEARFEHPVAELARSAVMLGTLFRDWGPVSPQVREGLLAGYQSQRSLSAVELAWWDVLVGWYSLGMIPPDPTQDTTGWRAAAEEHLEQATSPASRGDRGAAQRSAKSAQIR